MLSAVLGLSSAASGFVLSGALRAPVAQQAVQMLEVGASGTGTCKWFDSTKGFGFIEVDGEESDIFVHQSEIYATGFRSLADGEKVEFKVSADDRTGEHSPPACYPPRSTLHLVPTSLVARCIPAFSAGRPPLRRNASHTTPAHASHPHRTGKMRAAEVTGPDGAYVQGAPRQEYDDGY